MSDPLVKLAQLQPVTIRLSKHPRALKKFPLRSTAKMFAIADVIMACSLISLRFLICRRIVTFPLFQMISGAFYVLVSSFGLYQIFMEPVGSFPLFLICYSVCLAVNFVAAVILGLQTFDMGLLSDNCGDVEVCTPFVKPIAIAGWALTAVTLAFVVANVFMLITYWQLNSRVLDEQTYGYAHLEQSLSSANSHHHHHHHSHQHYPANYYHQQYLQQQPPPQMSPDMPKLKTPRPVHAPSELSSKSGHEIYQITKIGKVSKSSTPDSSTDYKSLPISPLEAPRMIM